MNSKELSKDIISNVVASSLLEINDDFEVKTLFERKMILLGLHKYYLPDCEYDDSLLPCGYIVKGQYMPMKLSSYNIMINHDEDEYNYEINSLGEPVQGYIDKLPNDFEGLVFYRYTNGLDNDIHELYVVDKTEGMDVLESFVMIDNTMNRGGFEEGI